MAAVLSFVGYGPVESLQAFLFRFMTLNVTTEVDNELERVWICHKSDENISEIQKAISGQCFDMKYHKHHYSSCPKLNYVNQNDSQSQFKSSRIIELIYTKLNCCLVQYVMTKCLILYNWGVNSFELIIDNEEFRQKLLSCTNNNKRKKLFRNEYQDFRKWRSTLTHQSKYVHMGGMRMKTNSDDLFEEQERENSIRRKRRKKISYLRLKRIYQECDKPFREIRQDNTPVQERFTKNKILYDLNKRPWPQDHALSSTTVDEMLKAILRVQINEKTNYSDNLLKLSDEWKTLRGILNLILQNHKSLDTYNGYGRILIRHLKSSGFASNCAERKLKPVPLNLVSFYIAKIICRVIPLEFFGSNRTRKNFISEISKIISGGKHQEFIFEPIFQIFMDIGNSLVWVREVQGSEVAKRIILKIVKWLLLDYVLLILRNHFYITELGSSGYRLYYFRKNDVHRAISLWLNSQMTEKNLCSVEGNPDHWNSTERNWLETGKVEINDAAKMEMSEDTEYIYPVANVRFLPKSEENPELRAITNYGLKKTKLRMGETEKRKLVESFTERYTKRLLVIRKVKLLLQFLVDKYGTGIRPLPNNPKLEIAWTKAMHLKEVYGRLYYVKADISNAFGSVLPSLLGAIIDEKLREKSNEVMQLKKIKECRVKNGKIEWSVRKSFSERPKENTFLMSRSIFVRDKKKLSRYDSKKLKQILDQIIFHQYLKINGRTYRLVKGLAQGSAGSLSPLLCDIYYSEMDRLYFSEFMTCSECVLLRGVDDYLLLTSDIEKATKFYDIVHSGIKDFNVTFSRNKLNSNIIEDIETVHYLGLIFDVKKMSAKPDYTRYKNKDILSTMRLCDAYGGTFFRKTNFLRFRSLVLTPLKLWSVTLNSLHNNVSVIREIVYTACGVQANRVMVLTRHLFHVDEKNDLDVCVILAKSLYKIVKVVTRLNRDISKDEIAWLFWNASYVVFRRYCSLFPKLLVLIKHSIFQAEDRLEKNGANLQLDYIKKDMRGNESWKDLRETLNVITSKSKPSNKMR